MMSEQQHLHRSMMRRRALLRVAAVAPLMPLASCSTTNYGDDQFHLAMATPGKDVMWVPTRENVAVAMLEAAQVDSRDRVYDLGSGDGVIPIVAARRFGARAVGIEYNPDLVALSQRNAVRAGVTERVSLKRGDIFVEDFSDATVVTLYLGEQLNLRLEPRLRALRPGTRIVSNTFTLGAWVPDRTLNLADGGRAFLWIVPAAVEGRWRFEGIPGEGDLSVNLLQRAQFFDLRSGGVLSARAGEGRLNGQRAEFELPTARGRNLKLTGRFDGDRFQGQVVGEAGARIIGSRQR
jgi:precorrin-6B methylase 2